MSNELSATEDLAVILALPGKYSSDDDFNHLSTTAGFLPRLMLMSSSSNLVKEGKINQGCYGLVRAKDQVDDLTKEVPCLPLAWRSKAMKISNDGVMSMYDRQNKLFQEIVDQSEVEDSGCMYGPEFLLWVPSAKCFATFYCSSKTSRREAPQLRDKIGKPALLKVQLIKGKKYSWFGPVVTACSVSFSMPSVNEITEQVTKFNNPPVSEKEAAPEGATDRAR